MKYINTVILLFTFFLICWPFSINGYSSQALGILFFLISTIINCKIYKPQNIYSSSTFLLKLIIFIAALNLSLGQGGYVFALYLIKIPIIIYITNFFIKLISESGISKNDAIALIASSAGIHCLIIYLQILFPEIQQLAIDNSSEAIKNFFQDETGGHSLRYYGINGFLFASDGVTFALFGIILKIIRISNNKNNYIFLATEYSCIILAALAARSALPLIFIYAILNSIYSGNWRNWLINISVLVFPLLIFFWIALNNIENSFFYWITEPFISSFESGEIKSNSLDETISTYEINLSFIELLTGVGYYSPSNEDYLFNSLQPSDSGYIRSIYVYGLIGLSLFIYYILKENLKSSSNKRHTFLKSIIIIYMLIFFFKSEFLYQNSFIVAMVLLNKIYEKQKNRVGGFKTEVQHP